MANEYADRESHATITAALKAVTLEPSRTITRPIPVVLAPLAPLAMSAARPPR
jgi:hypothetical protein